MMPNVELHLPMKGVLLGVGAALGQGFGIVLSKVGMNYYAISAEGTSVVEYIPFAATHMRIISGAIGFALIIAPNNHTASLCALLQEKGNLG